MKENCVSIFIMNRKKMRGRARKKSVVAFVERKGGQLGRGGNYFPSEPDFVNA